MSRLKTLAIRFDSNTDVFSPGDVIRGWVVVQVDATRDQEGLKNIQGLWVKFNGKAKTRWITSDNLYDDGVNHHPSLRNSTAAHSKKESYFDTVSVIFGKGEHEHAPNQLKIPPGTHAYPFTFQLPDRILPSAFEHKYGYIRYKVKATLSLIRTFSNKSFKTEKLFSVTGPMVDLNTMPQVQSKVYETKRLYNCCGCGATIEESITLGVPKQGYVPGESLYVTGLVDNREREEMCDFKVKFIQKTTFFSNSHQKTVENILMSVRYRVATPRGRRTNFRLGPMLIPPVASSGLPSCNIINIEYHMQCVSDNIKWKCTIVIGTVPLRVRTPTAIPTEPPSYTECTSADMTAPDFPVGVAASASALGGEAPPPSYEQAVGQIDRMTNERNREDYFGEDRFVPSYPYFNLSVDVPPDSR